MSRRRSKVTVLRHALPGGAPEDAVRSLVRSSFVGLLAVDELAALLDHGRPVDFVRRETIISSESTSDELFVVTRGHAKRHRTATDGSQVILTVIGPGDLVGLLPVVDGRPAIADITPLDRVEGLALPGGALRRMLTASPTAAAAILRQVSHQLRIERSERIEATAHGSRVRVGRRIVELADRWGQESQGSTLIAVSLSQEELGAWAGVSREATVKSLTEFRDRGWIETGRRWIRVRDLGSLRRRSQWRSFPDIGAG